jgi:hypothetical protein
MDLGFERFARWLALASVGTTLNLACGASAGTSSDNQGGAGGEGAAGGSRTAGAGTGEIGGNAGAGIQLLPGSWQVTYAVTPLEMPPGLADCKEGQFMLNVSTDGLATISSIGQIDSTKAEIKSGAYTLDTLNLCLRQTTTAGLTLQGVDSDGDGIADKLSGTVTGTISFFGIDGGDTFSAAARMDLTGVPDVTAPTLVSPSYAINPLDSWSIVASEALAPTASVALAGTPNLPLTSVPKASSDGVPLSSLIEWSTDVILPLSGRWPILGLGQDLSGRALAPAGELRTLADPGVFMADGFEGPLVVASLFNPSIITGVGNVPAISGAHSLWLEPDADVTVHLKRVAAEKTVHFSARAFGDQNLAGFGVYIEGGVVGGHEIVTQSAKAPSGTVVETGDPTWTHASEVQQFSLSLSESGSDVLVRLRQEQSPCTPFCGSRLALMVDDLRLE